MKPPPSTSTSTAVRRRRATWRRFIPHVSGAAILLAIIWGFRPTPLRVETAPVLHGPLVVSVLEEGKTRIRHRHTISPPVAGFLNRVELRASAPICAGETVLAVLEPASSPFLDPRARAEAEARVKAAEAVKQSRQAGLERAAAALDLAKKELDRAGSLRSTQVISDQEWDIAENRVQVLARELHAAEFALRVAEFEIEQTRAALQQARRPAGTDAEPLRILSPVDGYVLNVFEESARTIAAGEPIMEVGDPRDLEAEIELLSSDAVAVAPGAEVWIEQWGGEAPLRGRVSVVERAGFTKISALGVEEQRVRVRVDFLDPMPPGRELGDRYRVEARIVTWRGDDVLQLPAGALFRRGGEWMAFVVADGRARLRRVEIGHNNGVAAEVRAGLEAGDAVIVHPSDSVSDGARVASSARAGSAR
jgi:HlyD family secretion protein